MCYVTRKPDIPGYSHTNKRVYRKLYAILYKSSQKFCFKMLCCIRSRDGLEMCVRHKNVVEFPVG